MRKVKVYRDQFPCEASRIAKVLYAIVICITIIFLIDMSIFQNIEVYNPRSGEVYEAIQGKQSRKIIDEGTPLGIKTEYSWTQGEVLPTGGYLAFYIVHQYAEVYFNDELMYRLKLQNEEKIGKTPANNWVMIPLYPEDTGKEIRVNIIPVYECVSDRVVNFYTGSKFMIYLKQLEKDLPQILLSISAVGIGIIFIIISIFHRYRGKENSNLTYLGIFSFAIGLWKITDIRFASLMFPKNPVVLSYISISMLFIGVVPWTLSIKKQFLKRSYRVLEYISVLSSIVALLIIILQITNSADLRETLWITHIVVASIVVMIVGAAIYEGKKEGIDKKSKILYMCLLLCAGGAIFDMMAYYIQGHSSGILYTLIAFLIYIITMGYTSINEINHKANIDAHTGVFNKSRCNELLDENERVLEPLGVIMFDLNGLKQVNDTLGHETGDILIKSFAGIVRKNVYRRDFVGRYGGDEFVVVIKAADKQRVQQVLNDIGEGVAQYNEENLEFAMSYARGYVLSEDYPGIPLRELLKKADSHMYRNKKLCRNIN